MDLHFWKDGKSIIQPVHLDILFQSNLNLHYIAILYILT